jgi:hypothetical protein
MTETKENHERKESPELFQLGQVVATQGALKLLQEHSVPINQILARHVTGDWGVVCPEDAQANDGAVLNGSRILSAYVIAPEQRVWVITEWDRSATTVLMPEEY